MNIEIRDAALQARIQKQLELSGSGSLEELLARLLATQEEQDVDFTRARTQLMRRSIAAPHKSTAVKAFPKTNSMHA